MIEVGNTPLIKLDNIYAKLECINPTGSIKDRMIKFIIDESEKRGLLRKGMIIVEATSGNTGIALSYYAKQKGYDATIIMPESVTEERKSSFEGSVRSSSYALLRVASWKRSESETKC